MEDLCREVSHVAVEEHEEGLDDSGVQGEAGGESTQKTIDGSHQDAPQRNHEKTDHTEQGVDHSHGPHEGELLE